MCEFGEEFIKDWPLRCEPKTVTEFGNKLLKECLKIQKPSKDILIDIEDFIQTSNEFPIKVSTSNQKFIKKFVFQLLTNKIIYLQFPIDTCRVKSQPEERLGFIQKQISSAYPLIHEKVLYLIMDFLEHKRKYGEFFYLKMKRKKRDTATLQTMRKLFCVVYIPAKVYFQSCQQNKKK